MDISHHLKRLLLEKIVIGLEEPVTIKNVGDFVAKIDSGNSGYNVIHGTNLRRQGDVITFETVDADGQKQIVSKKLKETVRINVGSGHVEKRPVIELDVKFADNEYQKIPFSVANRTYNKNKILLCKDFINDELNALIDPSGSMLTKKESLQEAADTTQGQKPSAKQKFKKGLLNVAKGFQGLGKFTDAEMIGTDVKDNTDPVKNYTELASIDKELICKKLGCKDEDLVCYKLADYFGKFYQGGDSPTKVEQDRYSSYISASAQNTNQQQQQQTNNQQTQDNNQQNQQANNNQQTNQTNNTPQQERFSRFRGRILAEANENQQNQTNTQQQQNNTQHQQQSNPKAQLDAFYAKSRQNFVAYFYENKEGIKSNYKQYDKEVINANKQNNFPSLVDSLFLALGDKVLQFNSNSGESNFNTKFFSKLKYLTEGDLAKGLNSGFSICWGEDKTKRQCWTQSVVYERQTSDTIKDEELAKEAESMNPASKKIAQNYLNIKKQWQTNLFLKNQPLDLSQEDVLNNLQEALKAQTSSTKKSSPKRESRSFRRGRMLNEEKEESSTPQPEASSKIDLHMDIIQKEETDPNVINKELQTAITIVTQMKQLVRKRKAEGVEDEDWQYIIKCKYTPQLTEAYNFLISYFNKMGIDFV